MAKKKSTQAEQLEPKIEKTKTVEFLLSPTGKFNLAYHVGDTVKLSVELADQLIEEKYAKEVIEGHAEEQAKDQEGEE